MRIITHFSRIARFFSKKVLTFNAMRDILYSQVTQCVKTRRCYTVAINKIYFANLRAEMARDGITIGAIAEALSMPRDRISRMLSNQSSIDLNIACKIRNVFFPNFALELLFSEVMQQSSA